MFRSRMLYCLCTLTIAFAMDWSDGESTPIRSASATPIPTDGDTDDELTEDAARDEMIKAAARCPPAARCERLLIRLDEFIHPEFATPPAHHPAVIRTHLATISSADIKKNLDAPEKFTQAFLWLCERSAFWVEQVREHREAEPGQCVYAQVQLQMSRCEPVMAAVRRFLVSLGTSEPHLDIQQKLSFFHKQIEESTTTTVKKRKHGGIVVEHSKLILHNARYLDTLCRIKNIVMHMEANLHTDDEDSLCFRMSNMRVKRQRTNQHSLSGPLLDFGTKLYTSLAAELQPMIDGKADWNQLITMRVLTNITSDTVDLGSTDDTSNICRQALEHFVKDWERVMQLQHGIRPRSQHPTGITPAEFFKRSSERQKQERARARATRMAICSGSAFPHMTEPHPEPRAGEEDDMRGLTRVEYAEQPYSVPPIDMPLGAFGTCASDATMHLL